MNKKRTSENLEERKKGGAFPPRHKTKAPHTSKQMHRATRQRIAKESRKKNR